MIKAHDTHKQMKKNKIRKNTEAWKILNTQKQKRIRTISLKKYCYYNDPNNLYFSYSCYKNNNNKLKSLKTWKTGEKWQTIVTTVIMIFMISHFLPQTSYKYSNHQKNLDKI